MTEPLTPRSFLVEELEERFELASFAAQEETVEDDGGSCSGSCCIVGGNCGDPGTI